MSRSTIFQNERITVVGGTDHAVGKFLQIFDNQMEFDTPEGEGLVYDWSQMFGVETNFTGYPDTCLPEKIIESYINDTNDEINQQ